MHCGISAFHAPVSAAEMESPHQGEYAAACFLRKMNKVTRLGSSLMLAGGISEADWKGSGFTSVLISAQLCSVPASRWWTSCPSRAFTFQVNIPTS